MTSSVLPGCLNGSRAVSRFSTPVFTETFQVSQDRFGHQPLKITSGKKVAG